MKFTKKVKSIISKGISSGLSQKDSCLLAGINEATLCRWKNKYINFANELEQKEIEYKRSLIETVKSASASSWQAAAWLLERKFSEEFALKQKHEVTGPGGGAIPIKYKIETTE